MGIETNFTRTNSVIPNANYTALYNAVLVGGLPFAVNTGVALGLDANPNTTAPVEDGTKPVFRIPRIPGTLGTSSLFGTVAELTGSFAQQPWGYDDVRLRWFPIGAAANVSVRSTLLTVQPGMIGMKVFFQITGNASSITNWYITF